MLAVAPETLARIALHPPDPVTKCLGSTWPLTRSRPTAKSGNPLLPSPSEQPALGPLQKNDSVVLRGLTLWWHGWRPSRSMPSSKVFLGCLQTALLFFSSGHTRTTIYFLAAALFACDADTEGLDGPERRQLEPGVDISDMADAEVDDVIEQLCEENCAAPHRCFEDVPQENCSECISTAVQWRSRESEQCFQAYIDFRTCITKISCDSLIAGECNERFSSDGRCDFDG